MDQRTIDRHSVNCFGCNALVDERECMPGVDGEGDICPTCYCEESPTKTHKPNWSSISHASSAVGDLVEECILDVNCLYCGRSGAFRLDTEVEIDW